MRNRINGYQDLVVWRKSMVLVKLVYLVTNKFPRSERYGLTSQMRRCAVSIPSNIAEGSKRSSRADFKNFLIIAYGSGAELETQIRISKMLNFVQGPYLPKASKILGEVMKMLNKFISKL